MKIPKFGVKWEDEKEYLRMFSDGVYDYLHDKVSKQISNKDKEEEETKDYIVLTKDGSTVIVDNAINLIKTDTDVTIYDENVSVVAYFKIDEIKGFYAYKEPKLV